MSSRPDINPGDWIRIGNTLCVVSLVRDPGDTLGDCEVVLDEDKPANRDVCWKDDDWHFVPSGDFGGYADRIPRLAPYVAQLKRGFS